MEKEEKSIIEKRDQMREIDEEYATEAKFPKNMMIELTNACNLNCCFCYHSQMKRKIGYMTEELYTKIILEAKKMGIENVALFTTGESFLHPKIYDFIKIAKEKGIKYVYVTTNGQTLNEDRIRKIIDSGLDSLKFSIDASSQEVYEKIKIGAKWNKLVENVKTIKKIRDEKKSNMKLFASYILMENNYEGLLEYNKLFKDLIDETLFNFVVNQGSQVDKDKMFPEEMRDKFNKIVLPKEKWHPCGFLWNRLILTYDGKLTACCIDFEARLIYGDINKTSLKEAWNNQKMHNLRKTHKEKKFEKLPMCHNCDEIKFNMKAIKSLTEEVVKKLQK